MAHRSAQFLLAGLLITVVLAGRGPAAARVCSPDGWCWAHPHPQGYGVIGAGGNQDGSASLVGSFGIALTFDFSGTLSEWQTTGTTVTLWDVSEERNFEVYAVGDSGTILRRAGDVWSPGPAGLPGTATLHSVSHLSSTDIWVGGDDGSGNLTAWHWDGATWTPHVLETSPGEVLMGLWATTATYACAASSTGNIYHWNGVGWSLVFNPANHGFTRIWGTGPTDIFVAGTNTNTGQCAIAHFNGSWSLQSCPTAGVLYGIWGTDANDVVAVGTDLINGIMVHYDGSTWTDKTPGGIGAERFMDVAGSGGKYVAADYLSGLTYAYDGAAWTEIGEPRLTTAFLLGAHYSGTDFYAVGFSGTVIHHDGTTGSNISDPAMLDHLRDVWADTTTNVWVVGDNGRIRQYTGVWNTQDSGTLTYQDVWGTGGGELFIVGDGGASTGGHIRYFDGFVWSDDFCGGSTNMSLRGVHGSDPANVWAVGDNGTLCQWNSVSFTWSTAACGILTTDFHSVWVGGASDAVVVGDSGTICRWDGATWTQEASGTTENLLGVTGTGPSDLYAVGANGIALHYDGVSWTTETTPYKHTLTDVATSVNNVLATGIITGTVLEKDVAPSLGSCEVFPLTPREVTTPVAIAFAPSPDVQKVEWQYRCNGVALAGATHQRLAPQQFTAGDVCEAWCIPHNGDFAGPPVVSTSFNIQAGTTPYNSAAANGLWSMVSVPLEPGDHLRDDFLTIYRWDEQAQTYVGGAGGSRPDTIAPGEGAFVYVGPSESQPDGGREIDGTGTVPVIDVEIVSLTLTGASPFPGRHLLGVPFNHPIYLQNMEVQQAGGGPYVDIATAAGNGWIEYNAWTRYDNTAGQYMPFVGGGFEGALFPFEGYWLKVLTDVDVRIPVSQPAPMPVTVGEASPTPDEWTVTLAATAGHLRDDYNAFGIAPDASAGWDRHDASDGGTLNAAHVVVRFDGGLAHDIRPAGDVVSWAFTVDAADAGEVDLTWGDVPSSYVVSLVDTFTGMTIVMNDAHTYTYTPASDIEERAFTIVGTRRDALDIDDVTADDIALGVARGFNGGCIAAPGASAPVLGWMLMIAGWMVLRRRYPAP